ncbi:TPA: hypothetical protein RG719_001328 [Morganella morganii subsp. morganii]|nr:hypothetical protein [Morganella morganii subsp. morganii]
MSVLSDKDIKIRISSCNLVEDSVSEGIGPSCYELRMGDVYYDLTEDNKRIQLKDGDNVIIKPGHLVVLISKERLNIPNDILGRIISKGSLFSIGLTPACTNADPGFVGNIGIVTQNISNKYIELPQLESIAKIDFSQLSSPAEKPYRGQHGYHTQIWPIKEHLQKNHNDVKDDARVESEITEAYKITPISTVEIIKKTVRYQKINSRLMIVLILINAALIAGVNMGAVDVFISLAISLFASVIMLIATNLTDKVLKDEH